MRNIQQNRDQARKVAQELLNAKRQELKAGAPGKDIMSLLGSLSLHLLLSFTRLLRVSLSQSNPAILNAKTGE